MFFVIIKEVFWQSWYSSNMSCLQTEPWMMQHTNTTTSIHCYKWFERIEEHTANTFNNEKFSDLLFLCWYVLELKIMILQRVFFVLQWWSSVFSPVYCCPTLSPSVQIVQELPMLLLPGKGLQPEREDTSPARNGKESLAGSPEHCLWRLCFVRIIRSWAQG